MSLKGLSIRYFPISMGLIFCLAILLPTSRFPCNAGTVKNRVLAEIDGKAITSKDFASYLNLFKGDPTYQPKSRKDKERMLNHLIDRILLLEAAKKEGYDKKDILIKHPTLSPVERETFILRSYLMDHISRKVSVSPEAISAYRLHHPRLTEEEARERLIALQQKKLFKELMRRLRQGRSIRIFPENL